MATDDLESWCVDDAVLWFGLTIENALVEREEVGSGQHKEWRNKYSLAQLLESDFCLPKPEKPRRKTLLQMASEGGGLVKVWQPQPAS